MKRSEKRVTKGIVPSLVAAGVLGLSGVWAQENVPGAKRQEAGNVEATAPQTTNKKGGKK